MDELTVEQARQLLQDDSASFQDDNVSAMSAAAFDALEALGGLDALDDAILIGTNEPSSDSTASSPEEPAGEAEQPTKGAAAIADAIANARETAAATGRSYAQGSVGLGVDIVEIARMQHILERTPAFAQRIFSKAEQAYCNRMANPATHYALRFAAKEAVVKALGTGLAEGIGVLDIEVERAPNGRPSVKLYNRALEVADEQGVRDLSISLSYTRTDAVACAMAVTTASVQESEKRKDPMEELARQFKETRSILDDL